MLTIAEPRLVVHCTVLPVKTPKNAILCFLQFMSYSVQLVPKMPYQNDHQPSLIRMVALKVKDIASRDTKRRVYKLI